MKIAIFGASGWIGGTVAREALGRGHEVTAVVRDPGRLTLEGVRVVKADALDAEQIAAAAAGHDAAGAAISGRRDGEARHIVDAARALLAGVPRAGVARLVWAGGAGSLEGAPGVRLVDTPQFPAEWKPEALAQAEALELFRGAGPGVEWIYISPAAILEPGARAGHFRIGGDQLLTDDKGESRISVDDYAVAFVDEIERGTHARQRITVAY
ncbi:MAG TPA: NAD(P)-dependent oxidoreductase [Thermoanaerobaculia bacterium]|nr:NAD(P)-dependent oxidoreductase [Thermoanaerobaculia bacterium]